VKKQRPNIDATFSQTLVFGDRVDAAEQARLIYVDEHTPGIARKRRGRGFIYLDDSGNLLKDPQRIKKIQSLVIPPAWTQVWICKTPNGHIQATGRDARGRKQYIYHPRWQQLRNRKKFDRLLLFGRLLPMVRQRVDRDLALHGIPKQRAIAFVVRLLDITLLRVGNPEYARVNRSYGLTTLREDHIDICGSRMRFSFPGKGQKPQTADVQDRRLARLARKFQELPGQELVRYVDTDRKPATVESADVNAYLTEITGENFTAKDFRTWGATVHTTGDLLQIGASGSQKTALKNVSQAIKKTARRLGNTQTVCRRYYVHPAVIDSYLCGELFKWGEAARKLVLSGLSVQERTVMLLLSSLRAGDAGP
jgi:DNA topoisomerase I